MLNLTGGGGYILFDVGAGGRGGIKCMWSHSDTSPSGRIWKVRKLARPDILRLMFLRGTGGGGFVSGIHEWMGAEKEGLEGGVVKEGVRGKERGSDEGGSAGLGSFRGLGCCCVTIIRDGRDWIYARSTSLPTRAIGGMAIHTCLRDEVRCPRC